MVHDLENFRKGDSIEKDLLHFKNCDVIISHNSIMTNLIKNDQSKKIVNLEVFDYKVEKNKSVKISNFNFAKIVNYAGNLDYNKSEFIYKLPIFDNSIKLTAYGINFDKNKSNGNVKYEGIFHPDNPNILNGNFGLIWDGDSLINCEGLFGNYLKVNNPHKFSLYLSVNQPVIVWSSAAIANFVLKNKIGIVIENLFELEHKVNSLSSQEVETLMQNAKVFGQKVREGYFITKAVRDAEVL